MSDNKKKEIIKKKIIENNLIIIKEQIVYNFKNIPNYVFNKNKNTVLLIEPRFEQNILYLLANTHNKLGNDWNYVFYCGKSYLSDWKRILPNFIEIRPLDHDNFENSRLYSDFCKKRELWESLYGDYVLTIQLDTWIQNLEPYTIDYFIKLNKAFIGGNMSYTWSYFDKINIHHSVRNFNGGLSLRRRVYMIYVTINYPALPTLDDQSNFLTEHEDVYFTMGCIKINLPIGDDEESSHFSLHTIYHDKFFGIHQPNEEIKKRLEKLYPYLKYINTCL